ncbi:MAG: hypothetical protein AWM53_02019 [Candidatus Dichloromethanomonas elyunquensis]|nr:MAG: hypothetical protein AWM53_02019 [Candidatus Dichloromethanomonas elyunquensis]
MMNSEDQIKQVETELVQMANGLKVTSDTEYQYAGEFLKKIKTNIKGIEDFFADIKKPAHKAWKDICDKEISYKKQLEQAERIVKSSMSIYIQEQEQKRRQEEARIRAEQERIALEQLQKAEELKSQGNDIAAAIAEETAYSIDTMKPVLEVASPKMEGISYQMDWEVEITDDSSVPVVLKGMILRPVDLSTVKRLVKASKGQITIPGIKITETKNVRVRV